MRTASVSHPLENPGRPRGRSRGDHRAGALARRAAGRIRGFAYGVLGLRRATALGNLRRAFPDAPDEWIRQTGRAAHRHLEREAATTLQLSVAKQAAAGGSFAPVYGS